MTVIPILHPLCHLVPAPGAIFRLIEQLSRKAGWALNSVLSSAWLLLAPVQVSCRRIVLPH
jgi:hypothetical protein